MSLYNTLNAFVFGGCLAAVSTIGYLEHGRTQDQDCRNFLDYELGQAALSWVDKNHGEQNRKESLRGDVFFGIDAIISDVPNLHSFCQENRGDEYANSPKFSGREPATMVGRDLRENLHDCFYGSSMKEFDANYCSQRFTNRVAKIHGGKKK